MFRYVLQLVQNYMLSKLCSRNGETRHERVKTRFARGGFNHTPLVGAIVEHNSSLHANQCIETLPGLPTHDLQSCPVNARAQI